MLRSPEFAAWLGRPPAPCLARACSAWGDMQSLGPWRVWCNAPSAEAFAVSMCRSGGDAPSNVRFSGTAGLFERALGGGAPVHFAKTADGLLVSSRIDSFTRGLGLTRPHALATAMWFGGRPTFPDRQTPIASVRSLSPGERLVIPNDGQSRFETWFTPPQGADAPATPKRFEEHARELYQGLEAAVEAECERAKTLIFYSGGVDSSLLAAIALKLDKSPAALSFVPASYAADAARERALVEQRGLTAGFSHHTIVELTQRLWMAQIQRSKPSVFPIVYHASLWLPETAPLSQATCVLRGEFADEACGSRLRLPDYLTHFDAATALRAQPRTWPLGVRTPISALRFRLNRALGRTFSPPLLSLAPCFRKDLRAEYQSFRSAFVRDRTGLARLDMRDGILTEAWESAGALGIHSVFPFMQRRVLDLAYRLHPSELFDGGTKRILRAAGRGVSLETHRLRADKGSMHPASRRPGFSLPPLGDAARALLCPLWLERADRDGIGPHDALRLVGLQHMLQSSELLTQQFEHDHGTHQ